MNGKINFSLDKIKKVILKNRKKLLIVALIFFLYIFVVLVFKVSLPIPGMPKPQIQYSCLNLRQFINGYRSAQQDFDIEKLVFTEKSISLSLNVKFIPKTDFSVRKLAMDIIRGLREEYPKLEFLSIEVIRKAHPGVATVYGQAVFSQDDNQITWKIP